MPAGPDEINRLKLPSGLILIHRHLPWSPAVAYQLWVRAGSAYEMEGEHGLCHFLEHILFKGTPERDAVEILDEIERNGGTINAFTSIEETSFHVTMPHRHWLSGLDVLLDLILHPFPDEEFVEMEKQIIVEEFKEGRDSPDILASESFMQAVYGSHGYGRPVLGTIKDVQGVTTERLLGFFRRWYHPSRMILAVVGDVEWAELAEAVRERAGDTPHTQHDTPEPFPPPSFSRARFVINQGSEERILMMGYPLPKVTHEDVPALDLLSILLGEGELSHLFRELRIKRPVVSGIGSSLLTLSKGGLFSIRSYPLETDAVSVLASILTEIERFIAVPVSPADLGRAKLVLDKELLFGRETAENQARSLAYYEGVFGDAAYEKTYRSRILSVTEENISDVARRYLDPARLAVGALLPAGESGLTAEIVDAGLPARSAPRLSSLRSSLPESTRRIALPNGSRLVVRRLRGTPVACAHAAVTGGLLTETCQTNGIAQLTSAVMDRGTYERSHTRIIEETALLQADLTTFVGRNSEGLRVECAAPSFQKALDLWSDILTQPRFDESAIEQEKRVLLREVDTQQDYFDVATGKLFIRELYGNHPYGMDVLGSRTSLELVTQQQIRARFERIVRPDRLVVGVVSDDPTDAVEERLAELLGTAPANPPEALPQHTVPPVAARDVRRPISGEKAYVCMGFLGSTLRDEARYAVEVMATILCSAGSGRLDRLLREELGLVYSVDVTTFHGLDPGYIVVSFNTTPENVDIAREETVKQLERLRHESVPAEELERVRNYLCGSYELALERISAQAEILCLGELYGSEKSIEDYVLGIRRVTSHDLLAAAERYLLPDKITFVELSPWVN